MQKLLAIGAAVLMALPAPAQPGLSEGARLSAVYETMLAARFDQARANLASACPPAPPEACEALATAALWWRIQLDPFDRSFDKSLQDSAARAIADAERWTRREPERAEAWFYLAGAHGPLEQWRVLRGQRLAVAKDAARLEAWLERAVTLDPHLEDAYLGLGLYHYVADVAPATLKILRWLFFLPGGDRVKGLNEMQRARDQGTLLRSEADYQLHWLYIWYEHDPARAIDVLRRLDARYPSNPIFLQRIAEVQRDSIHDHGASLAAWQSLLDRARAGRVEFQAMADARARIGLAAECLALSQPARVKDLLTPVIERRAASPHGAEASAYFLLGTAYRQLGDRDAARLAFRAAIASAPADDPDNIRSRARDAM